MKKYTIILLLFSACHPNHDGKYVNHTENAYVIADDTLEVRDSVITAHTGYQQKRTGRVLPKKFKIKRLFELHPIFKNGQFILNSATYEKL